MPGDDSGTELIFCKNKTLGALKDGLADESVFFDPLNLSSPIVTTKPAAPGGSVTRRQVTDLARARLSGYHRYLFCFR
jgi:hypothetical protein